MYSLLPDLAPRDSHTLWYTSSRNPLSTPYAGGEGSLSSQYDAANGNNHHNHNSSGGGHHHNAAGGGAQRRGAGGAHLLERSQLARLRADEANLERRRHNVALFGSAWLKPVGVAKTLHQLREERREAEEHQEAMRREQFAQELAEAADMAANGGAAAAEGAEEADDADDDGAMDDVQLDGARDLDDDIPEAEEADFGVGSDEEEDEDDSEEESEDADDPEQRTAQAEQQLMQQRMRQADDAFRESMARGRDSTHYYGVEDEVDDEDQAQMIEEDDLVGGGDLDNMEADLDDDIPEAEDEGYEHTDSEAELSSDEEVEDDEDDDRPELSFAALASQSQSQSRARHGQTRSNATRNSLAISDLLSHDGSSMLGSSPEAQRRASGIRGP
ncbi:Apc15p protein-domain-containing protein [Hypoxylon sp. FL1284]|nr:Apc15p protein-domain-containing protein [Hypoxylon sp. FL1284]